MMKQMKLQKNFLNESLTDSEFAFNYIHLLYYKCHKINPNPDASYVNSPDWIKNEHVTINPIKKRQ